MSLYDKMIAARKGTDVVRKNILVTLYGEAMTRVKNSNGQRPENEKDVITDKDVQKLLTEHVKSTEEYIGLLRNSGKDTSAKEAELAILNELFEDYKPKYVSEAELRAIIQGYIDAGVERNIGPLMKALKDNHAGRFDGKMASKLIAEMK